MAEPIITEPFDPFLHLAFRYRCPGANISTTVRFKLKHFKCPTRIKPVAFSVRNTTKPCRSPLQLVSVLDRARGCMGIRAIAKPYFVRQRVSHAVNCFRASNKLNTDSRRAQCGIRKLIAVGVWKHKNAHDHALITYQSMSRTAKRGCHTAPGVPAAINDYTVKGFDCRVIPVQILVSSRNCNSNKRISFADFDFHREYAASCRVMPFTVNFKANRNCASNMHTTVISTFNWKVAVRLMSCRQSITFVKRPAFKNCAVIKPVPARKVITSVYRRQPIACKSITLALDSRKGIKLCNGNKQIRTRYFRRTLRVGVLSCRNYQSSMTSQMARFHCGNIVLGQAPLLVFGRIWGGVGISFTPKSSGRVNGDYNPE